jgi:pimeloyl-ACP methyl ester carboxylesterase
VEAANPRIQICGVPKAGHLVPLEQPREVARIISEFVQQERGAKRLDPSPAAAL